MSRVCGVIVDVSNEISQGQKELLLDDSTGIIHLFVDSGCIVPSVCSCAIFAVTVRPTLHFVQVGEIVDVFGEIRVMNKRNIICIVASFFQIKEDFMFEIERWLTIEYLYKMSYFLQSFSTDHSHHAANDPATAESMIVSADEISQRILALLSHAPAGVGIEEFYLEMGDVERASVEEQVSVLTLEGLVYTNHGKLNLL